ncbi:MAG: hypothetical protein KAS76_03505, partial [Thermoplasmatales archaeon]|nr:hypothetical protein [Thermoplasmatales archaeon]
MVTIEQETAARKTLLDYNKAMRNRVLKIIAEPYTNADQIYKDMAIKGTDENPDESKPILIYVNRKAREFSIVDFGSSMSKEELIDRFQQTGQEQKTHHKGSRSIFGQGISDLMFSRKHGGIISCIKGGISSQAVFKRRKSKSKKTGKFIIKNLIQINDKKIKVNDQIRKEFLIPEGNGTCVRFRYEQGPFPRNETLIKGLNNMYMLRFINNDPKRNNQLIFINTNGKIIDKPEEIRYSFREVSETDILDRINTNIDYERWELPLKGWVAGWSEPLTQGEAEKDEREGGLLIIDENQNVYDLTLFDYDIHDSARNLHGIIEIGGLRELINDKLNDPHYPEEILTNTRDGFDKNHPFYKNFLCPLMSKWLKPVVQSEEKRKNIPKSSLSREIKEKQKKAFSILNKLDQQLNKEITDLSGDDVGHGKTGSGQQNPIRPKDGIEFSKKKITLKVGKKYSLRLKVDTRLVPVSSEILIENEEPTIDVIPKNIIINQEETDEDDIFSIPIVFQGNKSGVHAIINAYCYERKASVVIEVFEEEIYTPEKVIEFYPKSYKKPNGHHGKIWLYVDTNKMEKNGKILFDIDENDIDLDKYEIDIPGNYTNYKGILKIENGFRGHRDGAKGTIKATFENIEDSANIEIGHEEIEGGEGPGGAFNGWLYIKMDAQPFQTFYNPTNGVI